MSDFREKIDELWRLREKSREWQQDNRNRPFSDNEKERQQRISQLERETSGRNDDIGGHFCGH